MDIQNIENSFEEIVQNNPLDKYLIVDFYTEECVPCKSMVPILSQIENENKGKINVLKITAEEHPSLAHKFDIQGVPFIVIFKGHSMLNSFIGTRSKGDLLRAVYG